MAIISFPPISKANSDGLLAVGGDLEIPSLILAYSEGIFPWPISSHYPLAWFCPDPRGLLKYKDLYLSKSLKKLLRQKKYTLKFNTQFEVVIQSCSSVDNRKGQTGTWITKEVIKAYIDLYYAEHAYSAEIYNREDQLVGGLYGVHINNFVSGESMFFKESNASKVALVMLMEHLNCHGITFLDTQMLTPVIENLGGKEISRSEFMPLLKEAKTTIPKEPLFPKPIQSP